MKKGLAYGLTVLGFSLAAGGCRMWQLATALEPNGLLVRSSLATLSLMIVVAAAAGVLFWLSRRLTREGVPQSYQTAFALPAKGWFAVYILSGALLVAAGITLFVTVNEKTLWSPVALMEEKLMGVLFPIAGVGVTATGYLGLQRQEAAGRFSGWLLAPGYCGCFWLVLLYLAECAEPNLMNYAFALLGGVCAALCCYGAAAYSFEKPAPRLVLWTGGMAAVLLVTELASRLWRHDRMDTALLVHLGYLGYVTAQSLCLATRLDSPADLEPWTPPAEEEVETEVTEDE